MRLGDEFIGSLIQFSTSVYVCKSIMKSKIILIYINNSKNTNNSYVHHTVSQLNQNLWSPVMVML